MTVSIIICWYTNIIITLYERIFTFADIAIDSDQLTLLTKATQNIVSRYRHIEALAIGTRSILSPAGPYFGHVSSNK